MRIAYFTESLPPLTDGVSRTMCRLVETLQEKGEQFRLFSPVMPDDSFEWNQHVRQVLSVPFPLYKYYHICIPYFQNISEQLDAFKPDIIHVVSQTLQGMYAIRYAKQRDIPVVSSYHTHFVQYFRYYNYEAVDKIGWSYLRWFHNKCAMNFAPSPSAVQDLKNQGINNVQLWQRGVDPAKFSPKFAVPRKSNVPQLLFVGRLVKEKDLDDLIDACDILRADGEKFELTIIGHGPMREELEARAPYAKFTGLLSGEPLAQLYATSDALVFPSTTETFGNVVLEAFASGTAVLGVRSGGVGDLITHEFDGLVSAPNDPRELAEHIRRIINDREFIKKMGQNALETSKKYTWSEINSKLLQNYREVIEKHAVRRFRKKREYVIKKKKQREQVNALFHLTTSMF